MTVQRRQRHKMSAASDGNAGNGTFRGKIAGPLIDDWIRCIRKLCLLKRKGDSKCRSEDIVVKGTR